jgi:signal transduction histidine kinase
MLTALEQEQQTSARLRCLDAAQAKLVFTVSNEVREPLASIAGKISLLLSDMPGLQTAQQLSMLRDIECDVERLVAIVSELLTVSPLEEALPEPEPDPVDIDALVRAAIESIRPIAQNHQLALQVDVRLAGAHVSGEAEKLDRVLMNLLDNAVKFTPPGGAIDAQARVSGDTVVIDVTDTGIGIDIEEQDRIFDQFFRARKATEQAIAGTGLGLAIARAITEQHHGTIRVCSEPGAGSTFTLTLPLGKADALAAPSRRVVSI